jgi:protein involved in polysaccharide export with SLBB domain
VRRSILALYAVAMLSLPTINVGAQGVANSSGIFLTPGDAIRIDVWRNKELSGEFPIAADGSITHPLYRELKVAGIPLPEVESRIRSFISRYEATPTFVVTPLLRVIVGGEVRQPNIVSVPPGTTVAQVLAMAGGPTERGRLDRVELRRQNGSRTLNVTGPDAMDARLEVHSGDMILVGRRNNVVQELITPASSILAALAAVTSVIIQVTR